MISRRKLIAQAKPSQLNLAYHAREAAIAMECRRQGKLEDARSWAKLARKSLRDYLENRPNY